MTKFFADENFMLYSKNTRETPTIIGIMIKRHFFDTGRKNRKGRNDQKRKIMHDPTGRIITHFVIVYTPGCLICW